MLTKERQTAIVELCSKLVRIKSYSGEEGPIIEELKHIFEDLGMDDVIIDDYGSIAACINGKQPGKRVLLDAHVDTVPVTDAEQWQADPFGGEIQAGRIYGRGASDMKGALSAMIYASKYFSEDNGNNFDGEIIIVGGVQEEAFEGVASRSISQRFKPDVVVIGESSNLDLKRGQRGRAEILVETFGKPAHSANPDAGINAVYSMMKLVDAMRELPVERHPVLGGGIFELTDIKSSPYPGLSVVPDYCKATYDRRLLVGDTKDNVLTPIQALIEKLKKEVPEFDAKVSYALGKDNCHTGNTIEAERFFPAWLYEEKEPFVRAALKGLRDAGFNPGLSHYAFCTNGSHYAGEAGIPAIGFGPSRENQAHVIDEYIEVSQLLDACKGYYGILCGLLAVG